MNTNSPSLKHYALILTMSITLLLVGASVFADSAALANNPAFDSDMLNLEGEWAVTQRIPAGTRNEGGYDVPSGIDPPWLYTIRFTRIGPNAFGGHSYKGVFVGSPNPGVFHADTFYGGVGVQLVQMRFAEETTAGRYYKLLSAKHQVYNHDPKRVEIIGSWVDVGGATASSGNHGSFVMVKR